MDISRHEQIWKSGSLRLVSLDTIPLRHDRDWMDGIVLDSRKHRIEACRSYLGVSGRLVDVWGPKKEIRTVKSSAAG